MLLPVARITVAAITGSLVYNTGRNVYETIQCTKHYNNEQLHGIGSSILLQLNHTKPIIASTIASNDNDNISTSTMTSNMSSLQPQSISDIQTMSRQQILDLYLHHCTVPSDLSILEGEWYGILLNNNGLVRLSIFCCTTKKIILESLSRCFNCIAYNYYNYLTLYTTL
jgi:hypothetical protein